TSRQRSLCSGDKPLSQAHQRRFCSRTCASCAPPAASEHRLSSTGVEDRSTCPPAPLTPPCSRMPTRVVVTPRLTFTREPPGGVSRPRTLRSKLSELPEDRRTPPSSPPGTARARQRAGQTKRLPR